MATKAEVNQLSTANRSGQKGLQLIEKFANKAMDYAPIVKFVANIVG